MATDRYIYVAGNQVSPATSRTDGPNAIPYEICVGLPLDWGVAPVTVYEVPRPLFDGNLFLGSRVEPREFEMSFVGKLTGSYSASLAEEEKDYARGQLMTWFSPGGLPVEVLVKSTSGTDRERVLTVKPTAYPSWYVDEAGIGQVRDEPHFFASVPLRASFPWWIDSTTSGMYVSDTASFTGTAGTINLTNGGHLESGIQVAVQGANTITGISFSITYGASVITCAATITLSPTTWHVFDFWCTDPLRVQLVSGAADLFTLTGLTSIRSSVTTWPSQPPVAQRGLVTVSAARTAGSGTGTVSARIRRRWVDP